ncbi:hypothetical protein CK203_087027 [Vitis vinifera]|uniref:Disease resistance protein n=1 Tax=Vitis vinifera TaxID=29760 RepID=A0A438CM08_VITVI|nr:hypothetical protein CK203_087027 [Vitis vinifera]
MSAAACGFTQSPAISELTMVDCGKLQLKRPASGFTALKFSRVKISNISQWKQLPVGVHRLSITECDSVKTLIEEEPLQSKTSSSQDCVVLKSVSFRGLKFLYISISEGDPTSLNYLNIYECPDLVYIELPGLDSARGMACPPTYVNLKFHPATNSHLRWTGVCKDWPLLQHSISGVDAKRFILFPGSAYCPPQLPLSELNDFQTSSLWTRGLQHLTSLITLSISNCSELQSFGEEGLQHLTSLETLSICCCPKLKSLTEAGLQHLSSLEKLHISGCPKLQYLTKERLPKLPLFSGCLQMLFAGRSLPIWEKPRLAVCSSHSTHNHQRCVILMKMEIYQCQSGLVDLAMVIKAWCQATLRRLHFRLPDGPIVETSQVFLNHDCIILDLPDGRWKYLNGTACSNFTEIALFWLGNLHLLETVFTMVLLASRERSPE